MEKCFKFKKDTKIYEQFKLYLDNYDKVFDLLEAKVVEIYGFKNIKKRTNVAFDQDWTYYLEEALVKEYNLEKKFTLSDVKSEYDEEGKIVRHIKWYEPKGNFKEFKAFKKFVESYKEINIPSITKPFMPMYYRIRKYKSCMLDDDFYIIADSIRLPDNFIEDTEEVKLSDFYKMLEERKENEI